MAMANGADDERDWTSLPFDIVISITERLSLPDYFRFCSVCPSWSSLSSDNFPIPSRSPSLLMCHRSSYFSILTFPEQQQRCYRLSKLPERINYLGYHHGWLVIAEVINSYLLNPITRVQVALPSFESLCKGLPFCRIGKIVISGSPSSRDGFFAVASFGSFNSHLAYCKSGDGGAWSLLETRYNSEHNIDDIVFRDDKLYVLSSRGELEIFDHLLSPSSLVVVSNLDIGSSPVAAWAPEFTDDVHLVGFGPEELLQVRGRRGRRSGEILRYDVYKFSRSLGSTCCWVEMKDLGGQSLFVSNKHSMMTCRLPYSNKRILRGNCIYFAEFESWDCESGDVRVYDMEKGLVMPFAPHPVGSPVDRLQPLHSLFWFVPSL